MSSNQRIAMCPHGYHCNGFMPTPALERSSSNHVVHSECRDKFDICDEILHKVRDNFNSLSILMSGEKSIETVLYGSADK